MRVLSLNGLIVPFAILFALATAQPAAARAKKHRVERSVPPAVTLNHGTPIIMQGLTWPKRPAPETDQPQQRAERPRMAPRGSSSYVPPSVAPSPMLSPQPTVTPYQPAPINSFSDRVTQCLHSFSFNAGLGNNPIGRDAYVRSCANN